MAKDDFNDNDLPLLDHELDAVAEGLNEQGDVVKVGVDEATITRIQGMIADVIGKDVLPTEPLYIEVMVALGNVLIGLAHHWLNQCDMEIFDANRNEIVRLMRIMEAHVASAVPNLEAVETPRIIH